MNTHAKHLSVIILIIMVFLLRFSSSATAGAASGVALFLNSVLPALLPFFVCSCILIRLGAIQAVSKALSAFMRPFFSLGGESMPAFVIGAVSGYPNGARVTAELYSQNHLPAHDAGRTYLLSSLASPSFILSAVAASMLKKPGCGWVLMLSHLLSAVTVYRFWPQDRSCIDARVKTQAPQAQTQRPLRICLDSIRDAAVSLWSVGSFIILFSALVSVMQHTGILDAASHILAGVFRFLSLPASFWTALLTGVFELSTGCASLAALPFSPAVQLTAISFLLGFGGLCIFAQCAEYAQQLRLPLARLFIFKLLQGIVAALYCAVLLRLFPLSVSAFAAPAAHTYAYRPVPVYGIVFVTLTALVAALLADRSARRS